jgi:hypothetical protein
MPGTAAAWLAASCKVKLCDNRKYNGCCVLLQWLKLRALRAAKLAGYRCLSCLIAGPACCSVYNIKERSDG